MRLPHTVTVLRAPVTTDGKGNSARDWGNPVARDWEAWVQPLQTSELTLNEDRVVSRWRIFLEPAADVVATDRVVWKGVTFQVDGEVQGWDTGVLHHLEGVLKRVSG